MKIAHLSTVLLMVLSNSVFAQSYKLSVENKTFENLTDSISINEGLTWDDPDQSVPIGFTWSFFDKQIDTLFMIGEGFLSSETLDIASVIYPVGADLIDRGQKNVSDDFHTNSLSPISYKIEGNTGSRIFKLEFLNAGFYSSIDADSNSTDFMSFQFWIFEEDNSFEIHFGPNSVSNPLLCYDFESGIFSVFLPEYDVNNDELIGEGMILTGAADNPQIKWLDQIDSVETLDGTVPNGMVFRFTKEISGIANFISSEANLFPNPATEHFRLTVGENEQIADIQIFDLNGKLVKQFDEPQEEYNIIGLSKGLYTVKITSNQSASTQKLIIQ